MPVAQSGPNKDPLIVPSGIALAFNLISGTTAAYTINQQDRYVYVDATSQAVTVTLPVAATVPAGFTVSIKKKDSSANAVTVQRASADTIDGATSVALAAQFNSVLLVCDGVSQWLRSSNAVATGGI